MTEATETDVPNKAIEYARRELPGWVDSILLPLLTWTREHHVGIEDDQDVFLIRGDLYRGVFSAARPFALDGPEEYRSEVRRRELAKATVARHLNRLARAVTGKRIRPHFNKQTGERSEPTDEPLLPGLESSETPSENGAGGDAPADDSERLSAALSDAREAIAELSDALDRIEEATDR